MAEKEWTSSFVEIAELLLEKKTLDSVFDTIARAACSYFNASASSIMVFDRNREYLTIARSYNLSPEYLKVVKVRRGEEIAGKVCETKKPRIVYDAVALFTDLNNDFTVQWIKKEGLLSLVCAPLLLKDEAIGCLNIYYRYPLHSFTEDLHLDFFTKLAALAIEHTQLIEESQNKTRMFSVLGDIGLALTSSFDINEIMKNFLSTATTITNADAGSLILLNESRPGTSISYDFNQGMKEPNIYQSSSRHETSVFREIIRTRKILTVPDIRSPAEVDLSDFNKKEGALLGVPLLAKDKPLGILYVYSQRPRQFTREEADYLTILCSHAAVALENSRLYDKIAREAKETAILYEVSQSFISSLDFDQLLTNILKRLIDTFGYLNLAIFLIDEDRQELRLRSYINYPASIREMRLKIGENGITGHVAATKKSHYAPDVNKDPNYIRGVKEAQSEVCFPLMIGDRIIGVIDVESPELNGFAPDNINLLSTLSAQIAIALENSRLFEEAKILSLTDPLTILPNRRSFEMAIDNEIKRSERYHRSFSVIMVDFDNFKIYNDKFGHPAGDGILHRFAQLMKESIRDVDFLGRYGGDEFVAILPETEAIFAGEVADRMRKRIAGQALDPPVTISVGIATFPQDSKDKNDLIRLADQACYESKQLGGNRISYAAPAESSPPTGSGMTAVR
jgi:diguanylate cyclase (GGDEF)-like protein